MNTKEKIQKIADTYGYDAQSRQCIEEMAELTQAINKKWRTDIAFANKLYQGTPDENFLTEIKLYMHILEEIADVQIMLWQMEYLLKDDVSDIIEMKLDRQIKRIEVEENESSN